MTATDRIFGRSRAIVHGHFLWLLVGAYALAALYPGPGDMIRQARVGQGVSVPMVLLGVLLFNAGIGATAADLGATFRRPGALAAGVLANLLVPIGFLGLLAAALGWWHDPAEAHGLVVGLGVVAAMPVAGSSAAWARNADGSPALSLALVVASTALSPLTTPATLAAVGPLAGGDYAAALADLAGRGTGTFLLLGVAVPSLAGIGCRRVLSADRLHRVQVVAKEVNTVVLLLLCYANAAAALPAIAADPDWDFLALVLAAAAGLCGTAFAAGWGVGQLVRATGPQTRSLTFALGMSNNGTGLVLVGSALAGLPEAVLPVLAYNLVQHLVAGGVHRVLRRTP